MRREPAEFHNPWVRAGSAKLAGCDQLLWRPFSGRYLSFAEREDIALLRAQQCGVREIARRLERSPSTIPRELRRLLTMAVLPWIVVKMSWVSYGFSRRQALTIAG